MNVCIKFHGSPSNSCWDISEQSDGVTHWQTDIAIPRAMPLALCLKKTKKQENTALRSPGRKDAMY